MLLCFVNRKKVFSGVIRYYTVSSDKFSLGFIFVIFITESPQNEKLNHENLDIGYYDDENTLSFVPFSVSVFGV